MHIALIQMYIATSFPSIKKFYQEVIVANFLHGFPVLCITLTSSNGVTMQLKRKNQLIGKEVGTLILWDS